MKETGLPLIGQVSQAGFFSKDARSRMGGFPFFGAEHWEALSGLGVLASPLCLLLVNAMPHYDVYELVPLRSYGRE